MQLVPRFLAVIPVLAFALALVACDSPGDGPGVEKPPNVLLISIDTLRADHVGSYGYHHDTTPFLDRLVERGTRFGRAYVNTHGTPPSHATLLTGLYQESHRVSYPGTDGAANHRLAEELVTLAESFGAAGYRTIAYTGGGWLSPSYGFDQGFEIFAERQRRAPAVARAFAGHLEGLSSEGDQPIFAFFHTYEVHSPYGAPPPMRGRFGPRESTFQPTNENLLAYAGRADELAASDLEALIARYDEGINFTDHALELLFDRLSDLGWLDHTIVVVTADHGEEFGDHGRLLHGGTLYEELVRVPLIVLGPGLPAGEVVHQPVSLVDIAPTLLELTGVRHDAPLAGRSLFDRQERSRVFLQYLDVLNGVVSDRWKLIRRQRTVGEGTLELYDLEADPHETTNLADERPEIVAELERAINEWRTSCVQLDLPSRLEVGEVEEDKLEELRALGYVE